MKKLITTSVLMILLASTALAGKQDYPEEYLGLPGDNLNLYAVMKLFQESETLEGFEKDLNAQDTRINNLDLNNDGYVDYLTVTDYVNGNEHTIVLRAVLDRNEYQDVAVFTVEKLANNEVQIQLIGDEALYGKNYIIEPYYGETPNPGYKGTSTATRRNVTVVNNYYNVSGWPVVSYIYNPHYVVWRSSWYWGYYPVYWRPWRPFYWHYYYGYHYHWYPTYYRYYRVWHQPRYVHYTTYYVTNIRVYSTNVSRRITEGNYRSTYSRPETRRDGEALYASTPVTRSTRTGAALTPGTSRRDAVSASTRSAVTREGTSGGEARRSAASQGTAQPGDTRRAAGTRAATQGSETRRATPVQGTAQPGDTRRAAGTRAATQGSETRRTTQGDSQTRSSETRRTPAATTPAATRSQSNTGGSASAGTNRSVTGSSSGRSSATVSRSSSAGTGRSSATVSRSSSSGSGRSSATVSRSSSSGSGRSSATVSRSSGSASRSSGTAARSSSSRNSSSGSVGSSSSSRESSTAASSGSGRSTRR